MWEDYFSFQIFFIILRETIESAIIVSVLLSFLKQNFTTTDPVSKKIIFNVDESVYHRMRSQVWIGAFLGLSICFIIGLFFIVLFYFVGTDLWSVTERIWEGTFSIISCIIIAVMGFTLLRINAMKTKWRLKLVDSFNQHNPNGNHITTEDEQVEEEEEEEQQQQQQQQQQKHKISFIRMLKQKYFLALLPFITTLREGLEAVVFIGGIGVNQPISSFPLAIILGSIVGGLVGYTLYKGGNKLSLQYFLIVSTCFLYLVAAGLISRGVWFLELERFVRKCGQDTSETGSGPGSYDVGNTIWHVNCCNGLTDGGWMLFNALLGWSNTATYGSIISYVLFWLAIIMFLNFKEKIEKHGYLTFLPITLQLKIIQKRILIDKLLVNEILVIEESEVANEEENLVGDSNYEINTNEEVNLGSSNGKSILKSGDTLDENSLLLK